MQPSGWLQFALYFVALVLITKPMGLYLLAIRLPFGERMRLPAEAATA